MPDLPQPESNAAHQALSASTTARSWWRAPALWALVGALGILLVAIYGANKFFGQDAASNAPTDVTRNASPGIDGVIATEVPADQLESADCLQGFTSPLDTSTVVTCQTAHNAQLIGSFSLDGDTFPGSAKILDTSEKLCKSIALDPSSPLDAGWSYHFSRPSESSWKNGDRVVDCFLALNEGSVRISMLPAPTPAQNT